MRDNAEPFDLIIVGSGSGNAIPDYMSDWRIAIVERAVYGGTCLNVGCIPSKMFVLPADMALQAGSGAKVNIDTQFNSANFGALRDRVFGRIDKISADGRRYRATGSTNITLLEGTARFIGDKKLEVSMNDGSGRRLVNAPKVLLAAGSRPIIPPIPGLAETGFHTSDTIMRLPEQPCRLGILGGGFIAVEMGHVFSGLGSEVTLINRSHGVLRGFDEDVRVRFIEVFSERVGLRYGHTPTAVRRNTAKEIEVDVAGETLFFDQLLVATGRQPNSDWLNLKDGGIKCHPHGTIKVDDTMATETAGVWAIGDIANDRQLKHLANAEAKVAFWNIAHADLPGFEPRRQSYKAVPAAVFSNPQIACVGLTELEAIRQGIPHKVGRRDYAGTAYGWALVDETSFAKVIVNTETGFIVGAHIIGPQAATLIQPITQAMELDTPAVDVAEKVFYIHPALTEVIENALLDAL